MSLRRWYLAMGFLAALLPLRGAQGEPPLSGATPAVEGKASWGMDREITFPGFNAHPLKGSVRAGRVEGTASSGFFALLVAGSGPMDRDWSSPLIRDSRSGQVLPSHAGRDFAAWLAGQGIGSLRYDKRFLGSRDPKLDISLDAQVGDIRAALGQARTLPEARGRRLLLVGHGEGALLSLLVAKEADALLLLALPPQTMAVMIRDQVRLQLPLEVPPANRAALNLAYLDSVLKAIRERQPLPEAGGEVFPGLRTLVRGLTRPESLGFVRDTLDLDPWKLAARLVLPCAVAWGDRDLQAWKPALIPSSFPGTVLDLSGANHLLKREMRPRGELNGANAAEAYGDGTPMADLAPLEDWLRRIGSKGMPRPR